mmetsp:Transcript_34527/g.33717  ORF Transcript_34527/g.33717 Transcript_34527/m.33717 type:complete len:124 (-) Transcript_34527:424-795(-)|eukprot:CAMPEP_0170560700 /NCGR_PEP_ID=MMETSP0211-20121228/50446_1 /TAXON_ID=311385 /ORGANISM="Pseudokeronopsis sp., Strain OXSARD2" /LENGTH=123 /DNA_ID=CAMNT_0010875237 /DNA_START=698 /DNA_END=1069 /DNA_ORIENTATION=-
MAKNRHKGRNNSMQTTVNFLFKDRKPELNDILESDLNRDKFKKKLKQTDYNVIRFIQKFKNFHNKDALGRSQRKHNSMDRCTDSSVNVKLENIMVPLLNTNKKADLKDHKLNLFTMQNFSKRS